MTLSSRRREVIFDGGPLAGLVGEVTNERPELGQDSFAVYESGDRLLGRYYLGPVFADWVAAGAEKKATP